MLGDLVHWVERWAVKGEGGGGGESEPVSPDVLFRTQANLGYNQTIE